MTASPEAPDPTDPPPRRKQMNVRLPEDLIESIDTRRQRKGLSRDAWVERALRYALRATDRTPASEAVATAPGRRTARLTR